MRALLLVLAVALAAPATASGAVTLSRDGGTMRIVDDPGGSAFTFVTLGISPVSSEPSYYAYESPGYAPLRAGPGCTRKLVWVACPAAGVTQIVATLGDGNDVVSVDAGPAALVMDGGPGDDKFSLARPAASVTITGGDGDDSGGVNGIDDEGHPLPASTLPGSVVFDGGAGKDDFGVSYYALPVTARGGDGDDSLESFSATGPVTLDGGAGNDFLSIGSDDPDMRLRGGGRTSVIGGPGDDDIQTGPDGDEDSIDCGPGHDRLRFNELMYRYPSLENTFTLDCPPVGVRLDKRATLKGRVVRFTLRAPRRLGVLAALWTPRLRRPVGKMARPVGLHAGANRVSVRLTKAGMHKIGRGRTLPLRLFGFAISPSDDAIEIRRGLQVKRVGG